MATDPKKKKKKYSKEKQTAIKDSVRAIKDVYGEDVSPTTINNILGNIEIETGWKTLREKSYSWGRLKELKGSTLKTANKNVDKWGKGESAYNKLSSAEKLSVMYYGDTDHQNVAGGTGVLQLTSANYGGNDSTATDIENAAKDLGIDTKALTDDFYNSTLLTLQVYKNRGEDFSKYGSAREARKKAINPYEKFDDLNDEKKSSLTSDFDLSGDDENDQGVLSTSSSVNPDMIANNPNISEGAREELFKMNEGAGLQPDTISQLESRNPLFSSLDEQNSFDDLNTNIVNNEASLRSDARTNRIKLPAFDPSVIDKKNKKPTSQQNKPEAQQSSTDFLIDYLGKNEFNMGGQSKNGSSLQYDNGGKIQQGLAPQSEGGMTHIPDSAGTHSENPNGGVQVGTGANGKPNTVEGNETMKNNYVYSDSLILDETIIKKVGLPKNFKGKTIAEASKIIQSPMDEQPNDKVVKDTGDESLEKLKNANEILRLTEELLAPQAPQGGNSQGPPQGPPQEGMSPSDQIGLFDHSQQQNQAVNGMDFNLTETPEIPEGFLSGGTDGASSGPGAAGYMAMGTEALRMGKDAFGSVKSDESGMIEAAPVKAGSGMLGSAMSGASAGMALGPWGAAAGAVLGATTSLIGGAKKKNAAAEQNQTYDARQNAINSFKFGGGFGDTNSDFQFDPSLVAPLDTGQSRQGLDILPNDRMNFSAQPKQGIETMGRRQPGEVASAGLTPEGLSFQPITATPSTGEVISTKGKDKENWWDRNNGKNSDALASAARYAPAAMNAYQLANLKKPKEERLDRLDSRYKPQYMDERTMQNQADEAYTNAANAITGASGGSQSALRANLLGAHLNRQKGLSGAYAQASGVNRGENSKAQTFNLGVDTKNIAQSNQEKDWNARNIAAYDSNKSKLLSQIGTDIGAIGLEETRKKYPERLGLLYDYLGKYSGGQNS
tara:strand:+ start:13647 stop:16490 length:2844 start_codon:yes stop_codon:yes gene_type:complete